MTRELITERLLEQGHIVIQCADRILNHKGEYLQDIEDLHRDGNISTSESIILLKKNSSVEIPFVAPGQYYPPTIQPYTDWTWDPNRPGTPSWTITCSHDLDKNSTDK